MLRNEVELKKEEIVAPTAISYCHRQAKFFRRLFEKVGLFSKGARGLCDNARMISEPKYCVRKRSSP